MRLKLINGLISISFLINISSAVYYQSTNQFLNNNIYPRQLPSSNWIPTNNNYNQNQQHENENSYLSIPSAYTQKDDASNINAKAYENYMSDITQYGQSSNQKPIITNEQKNQKLLLKSSSYVQPYGNHQEQQQQQSMIYSTENFYPYYSIQQKQNQQKQSIGPSSLHKLSPAITLISEQQQQQQNHQDYNMKTESLVGKIPIKSIMSSSKLSPEQTTGYGFSMNGYNDGTSERYTQNINEYQQQQNFIPYQYATANYQPLLNDGHKSDESRSNIDYSTAYENNDNSYHKQLQQPYTNLNNFNDIKLNNLMQVYTNYMENQLQNHKKFEESKNQQEIPSPSKYYQYVNNIVQSNERNKILNSPNSASINISQDISSGSNLIDGQHFNNIDVSVPMKTVYYQPHEIILSTSAPPPPPSSSISNPINENHYPKINYYYQPTDHNKGIHLHNYYSDKIKSILQSSAGGQQYQTEVAAYSLHSGASIPFSKHIVTKHMPIYKHIHIPHKHPVKINMSQPVIMTKPYPIQIPITKPISIPMVKEVKLSIEKIVPDPVEKKIPYPVEKRVPYNVEKYVRVPIVKPYPVRVPIVKTILHKSNNYFGEWPF